MRTPRHILRFSSSRRGAGSTGIMAVPRSFSLTELLIAMGILGIGLTMAAALFPAAIKLNQDSAHDTIGTLIAENGLTVASTNMRMSYLNADPSVMIALDPSFAPNDYLLRYPSDPAVTNTTQGIVVLGRRIFSDPSQPLAQLVIVSYEKQSPSSPVTARQVNIIGTGESQGAPTVNLDAQGRVGSPLILAKDGTYARITGWSLTGVATLDHKINSAISGDQAFVIEESGSIRSPATAVLMADVFLEQ